MFLTIIVGCFAPNAFAKQKFVGDSCVLSAGLVGSPEICRCVFATWTGAFYGNLESEYLIDQPLTEKECKEACILAHGQNCYQSDLNIISDPINPLSH
ncbi:MAG: hypothetical protein KDD53_11325 [Bdellovibrionales bacterium]|nr:hypothetical protein [Bdellovibrionales bacterium]